MCVCVCVWVCVCLCVPQEHGLSIVSFSRRRPENDIKKCSDIFPSIVAEKLT